MVDICTGIVEYLREFIKVILIVSIFFIITMVIIIIQYKTYIQNNWIEFRCNPLIMPFATFFGHDASENMGMCMMQLFTGFGGGMMQPLGFMTGQIGGILKSFTGSLQDMKSFIFNFRNLHLNFVQGIMGRIEDGASTLQYTVTKFKAILERLWGIMVTLIYTSSTTVDTMTSVFTGPIGSFAKIFCFDGNNKILMENQKKKKIRNIKINDKIHLGGKVLGVLKFTSNHNSMCDYNGVIISSSHLVKEKGTWKRIIDTDNVKMLKNYSQKYIYCLITEKNIITCNNCIFRDHIETSNPFINNKIKNEILKYLNNSKHIQIKNDYSHSKDYYCSGFSNSTLIKMRNGPTKIKDINIGDLTEDNQKVIGIIIQDPGSCEIYKYNNIIVSGNQIVFHHKKWKRIKDINNLNPINYNKKLYNICTNNNLIKINKYLFRDYEEVNSHNMNGSFDNYVEDYLNKTLKKPFKKKL